MRTGRLLTAFLLAVLATAAVGTSTAFSDDDDGGGASPSVLAQVATEVTETSARLTATVALDDSTGGTYRFDHGPTSDYGVETETAPLPTGSGSESVSTVVEGLTPGTTYHFRVHVKTSPGTKAKGGDATFTTSGSAPTVAPPTDASPGEAEPQPAPEPEPVLGRAIVAEAASGTIRVKLPGAASAVALADVSSLPVGALVDARRGSVRLQAALPAGEQTGTFGGAQFVVRQSAATGMTDIVLRGGDFSACGRGASGRPALARAAAGRRPKRKLWARDRDGRFRTHGQHSVATVRGTEWVTEDHCEGTLTRVKAGAVEVRDRRTGRRVLVRAGRSHLARAPR